ncbi:hypothetical protein FHW88_002768 [Mucilaginibacter sp. SG538B]|nr:hypothetical protein [Mucilaginibacter sp. SG538B]
MIHLLLKHSDTGFIVLVIRFLNILINNFHKKFKTVFIYKPVLLASHRKTVLFDFTLVSV